MPTATGIVTATYLDAKLAGQAVRVTLTPTAYRAVDEGLVLPRPVTIPITNGTGSVVVAATTTAWKYRVHEQVGRVARDYYIDVPAGGTIDLKNAVALVPPDPLIAPTRTVAGVAPDATGDVPAAPLQVALGVGAGGVPITRQVIAGTGLTGGGDLTVDRTLAVAYGTAAGTAAAGNDVRILGALQSGLVGAAGDLLAGTGAGTVAPLPVGPAGHVLTSTPAAATKLGWAPPPTTGTAARYACKVLTFAPADVCLLYTSPSPRDS